MRKLLRAIFPWLYKQGAILGDNEILREMDKGTIKIVPFVADCLGTNSYDCHLSKKLAVYDGYSESVMQLITNKITLTEYMRMPGALEMLYPPECLDAKVHNKIVEFEIPETGFIMYPFFLYLGVTQEYTETMAHVPFIEGKSSVGRLGIDIHATAGKGDVGFKGNWTLELSVKQPVKVYAGMPIGQLIYLPVKGNISVMYNQKQNAKYSDQAAKPVESMMWKNKF